MGVGKSRFFALLREYRLNPDNFSVVYQRATPTRLPASVENEIEKELLVERGLVEDSTLPITTYNYLVVRDRLLKNAVTVSLPTIIERAKGLDCYHLHPCLNHWVHLNCLVYPDAKTQLRRGMPLIKWFLTIPHYIMLVFLSIAAVAVWIIAWFTILYPGWDLDHKILRFPPFSEVILYHTALLRLLWAQRNHILPFFALFWKLYSQGLLQEIFD